MKVRYSIKLFGLLVIALVALGSMALMMPGGAKADPMAPQGTVTEGTYENPLEVVISNTGALSGTVAETWADPAVIKGHDGFYYAYATTDALANADRDGSGNWNFHKIPMARSADLVNWTYIGDAFSSNPSWAEASAGLWAPEVRNFNGVYYMYFGVTDVKPELGDPKPTCGADNAIGVAVSDNPWGPWTFAGGGPVVHPRQAFPIGDPNDACSYAWFWTYDPAVIQDDNGQRYLYFGSYFGGIFVRQLSKDGTTTNPASEVQVTIANRYEGAYVVRRDGFYYMFVSATDCCRGPLTGYSVFAGRSTSPTGPFVDRLGIALTETRVGGTPVISMNGNKWMGPGHNSVITDEAGQDWFFYHAIDRGDAYLDPDPADPADPDPYNINKRPMLMDRLSWINGWPSVRSGHWASDSPQPVPVTAAGGTPQPTLVPKPIDVPGSLLPEYSDEFNGALEPQWDWVREPPSTTYSLTEHPGFFRFRTQQADLYEGNNSASVLTETAPAGEFMVETKFEFNLPPSNCCFNYQQAGIVLYQDDDRFLKLVHFSLWETRQTEWAKEVGASDPDRARNHTYGNTVISSPGQPGLITTTTWLRIVKRIDSVTGQQYYTGYVSSNGFNWDRGATWTHNLTNVKIGLVAMGRGGDASDPNDIRTADFDYVRVYTLAPTGATATPVPTTPTTVPSNTSTSTSTTVPSSTSTATRTSTTVPSSTSTTAATAVPSATATACTIEFADVPPTGEGSTFYEFIRCLACRGIVGGYPCGGPGEPCNENNDPYYRPGANVTRGQLSKIIAIAAGLNDPIAEGQQQFADVPPGSPFYEFVERLAQTGAIAGYPCGGPGVTEPCDSEGRPYFRPNNPATRGQISKIVSIAAGFEEDIPSDRQTFTDVDQDSPFWVYIERLSGRGIISGYGEASKCPTGTPCFRYNDQTTRGQMAKIAANAFFPNCQTPARP